MSNKFYTNIFSRGDKVYVRGYRGQDRFSETVNYKPYLFLPSKIDSRTEFHTLDGQPVDKMNFDSISDAREFVKTYSDVSNFEIYGLTDFKYLFIYDNYPGEIKYDVSLLNIIGIDIETQCDDGFPDIVTANKEVTAITLSRKNGEKVVFGMFPYKPKSKKITFIQCKDEYDLLEKFIYTWQSGRWMPDIVTGWNIEFFDIPYLVNRITNVLGRKEANKLSPWGILEERTTEVRGKEHQIFIPAGVNVLDYYALYRKFSFGNEESYKLDHIAEIVLNEKKLDYSEYGSLHELYTKNYELFIDYNIHDVTLIDMLEEKLKFIEQVVAFAYDAKVNYADTFTTVRPWDIIIHNYLLDRACVVHQFKKNKNDFSLVGGYVKEPKIGMNKWVVSFDLNSLYPHLIMGYNISPETLVHREHIDCIDVLIKGEYIHDEKYSCAANGVLFKKNKQGFLPALMEKMYNDRVEYKNKMIEAKKKLETIPEENKEERRLCINDISKYHNLQLAKKIQLNSAYGALGNNYFRWFNFDMAEAITMSGQLSIRWIEKKTNEYMNKILKTNKVDYVIASDTDSIYVNMEPLVLQTGVTDTLKIVEMLDIFCKQKIDPMMEKSFKELAEYMNAYQQKMFMKRETIAEKGIWKAKKMYILNAWNIEGVQYSEPQLKIQGIEAVRSSTPKSCRKNIKKALSIIMNSDEKILQKFIIDFKTEFLRLPFEEVAFPRGMNGIEKYRDASSIYLKGTPIHVKGALLYNNLLEKHNLTKKYQKIDNGDKIKFAYLKLPNPVRDTVISVFDQMPEELKLDKYIDREMQFQKAFLDPITSILDIIGWSAEKRSTLEGLY